MKTNVFPLLSVVKKTKSTSCFFSKVNLLGSCFYTEIKELTEADSVWVIYCLLKGGECCEQMILTMLVAIYCYDRTDGFS